eukprot:PLAT3917.1.p1 GENE.PLAT3917.1~~PLAT3917.1.p1  ORF type:complete len:230 (-),score=61.09 PLAT3917.1:206-868(-)
MAQDQSSYMEHGREPCPWRILDDMGAAFLFGTGTGVIWFGLKGARNSPRGERLLGSIHAIKARVPVQGGGFAMWGGLFSSFDCAIAAMRGKEDPFNSIASGFLTGGVLAARAGWRIALGQAMFAGVFVGLIEGLGVMLTRSLAPPPPGEMAAAAAAAGGASGAAMNAAGSGGGGSGMGPGGMGMPPRAPPMPADDDPYLGTGTAGHSREAMVDSARTLAS